VRQAIVRPNLYENRRILGDRIADADADAQVALLNGDGFMTTRWDHPAAKWLSDRSRPAVAT